VTFHRQWVLPLADRQLCLDEMTPEASVESSWMASDAISTDELLQRVKGTVGKTDYFVIVPMRPEEGFVSLVSLLFFFFDLQFLPFRPSLTFLSLGRDSEASRLPDPRSQGRGGQAGAPAGGRRAAAKERRGKEVDPQEYGGPRRVGDAPQSAGEGGAPARVLSPALRKRMMMMTMMMMMMMMMEVRAGFSPEARLSSAPASTGPSGDAALPSQGPAASLSEARASVELAPIPAEAKEAEVVEEEVTPLPVEAFVVPAKAAGGHLSGRPLEATRRRGLSLPLTLLSRGPRWLGLSLRPRPPRRGLQKR
jgi:hypothetical protein